MNSVTFEQVIRALHALHIEFQLIGPERSITRVCSLLQKEPNGLYYYTGASLGIFQELQDSVVICRVEVTADLANNSAIIVKGDPQVVFYQLCNHLFDTRHEPGIHSTAIIHPEAQVGSGVYIGAYTVIGRCSIGEGTNIHSHVVVQDGCEIGARVVIEPHCCIGATGVVWVWVNEFEKIRLPQLGGVRVGNDVFLGTDVSIVRGALNEFTTIGNGCMLAPGSKIGHSVIMEDHCHLANNVSIAGSAYIGARCFIGSGASVRSHAKLASDIIVGSGAVVAKSFDTKGITLAGVPAKELAPKKDRIGVPRNTITEV